MPDQTLLSDEQDSLMMHLTLKWQTVCDSRGTDPDAMVDAAEAAVEALRTGGMWPDPAWVENILMIGANSCAAAVLNHGRYEHLKEVCNELYQEVLNRRWLQGGPEGVLEQHEVEGLARAVGQWQR